MAILSFINKVVRTVILKAPQGLWGPLRVLAQHPGLFRILIRRESVARTSGTVLGGLWVLAQPALLVGALWFLLDVVLRVRFPGQAPFLNYFLIGMLPWLAMNEILQRNLLILAEFGPLYQRTVFPLRMLPMLPLVLTGGTYGAIFVVVVALLEGVFAGVAAVLAIFLLVLWLIPFSYLFAVAGLFIKDARQIIPFALTMLMYITPILYLPQALPEGLQNLMFLNPVADVMTLIHALLQGLPWTSGNLLRPLFLWLLLLGPAWVLFQRAEPHMREEL